MAPFAVCKNRECSFVFDMQETDDSVVQLPPEHCVVCHARVVWYCPECACPLIRIPTPLTPRCWRCGLDLYRSLRYSRAPVGAGGKPLKGHIRSGAPQTSACRDELGPLRAHKMCNWNRWNGERFSLAEGFGCARCESPTIGQGRCSRYCVGQISERK